MDEYQNGYISRGAVLPVRFGEPTQARCGECGLVVTLPATYALVHTELDRIQWLYTSESGWVCVQCAPLPRLTGTEPNRQHRAPTQEPR